MPDPARLLILRLIRHFGMINTEIAGYMGLARPTVSLHARLLREAGLIRSRRDGREVRRLLADLEAFLDLPYEDEGMD